MKLEAVLTVAQSKRLIARGVQQHPVVKTALNNGTIGICRGTTCSYVAEEFLGHSVERFAYTTGLTLPKKPTEKIEKPTTIMHDVIIRQGDIHMDGETVLEAAKNMKPGDVIIKSANALNYSKNVAGCLVGHPAGGTVGGFWGPMYGLKIRLIIPVGLEKEIASDIIETTTLTMEQNSGNTIMPMTGTILTEIEAINILTGAVAVQIAAGGIRGAEGSVRLLIQGSNDEMSEVKSLLNEIGQEPPY
ncbi:hypothetical protein ACFL47_03045 [Candidatus Latescibacterota bacterium]